MSLFSKLFGISSSGRNTGITAQTKELVTSEWEQIDILLSQKGPSQLRQGLIKADKSLDAILKDMVSGETMGERLKYARDNFEYSVYDRVWKAHKMRNSLVHDAGYEPPYHMVTGAIEDLRKAIKQIGVSV
jgi:hypothetical protein